MQNVETVLQIHAPCVLHKYHAPISVINELHHPIPKVWQLDKYGEVVIGPQPICATSHNSYHEALRRVCNHGKVIPEWCRGPMRDMVEYALAWRDENLPGVKAP